MSTGILIYAELLANIRQISVIVVLPTPSNSKTTATISSERQNIILQHEGRTTSLKLPGQVDPTSQFYPPGLGKTELSWRLAVAGQPSRPEISDAETPWPAKDLDQSAEIACKECRAILVKSGSVKTWKDLPSENWAEMMEFWHCHKPDDEPSGHEGHSHSHSEDPNASKGYGASSKFIATSGVGFIDISTFLLAESDCQNFETLSPSNPLSNSNYKPVSCSECHTYIGHFDTLASGFRLYKYRLHLSSPTNTNHKPTTIIPTIQIHTTQFSSIITSQVTSRLVLIPLDFPPSNPSAENTPSSSQSKNSSHVFLSLWILSPSIRYSATSSSSSPSSSSVEGRASTKAETKVESQPAMKIFYQSVSPTEAEVLMAKEGVEEVLLPWEAIAEIKKALVESKKCLPPGARMFKEWDVGLLERFGV